MLPCKFLVIGGVASGVGKSSLTIGIVAALVRKGLRIQTYKVGPDFLDPTWLTIASGRACFNLDTWMCSSTYRREMILHTMQQADVGIIEGVMGLYDGRDPTSIRGSTAEIALELEAPIILVIDAWGMAGSICALVKGFTSFIKGIKIQGVIANFCGSAAHAELLKESLAKAQLPPLLGWIEKGQLPPIPERHLGIFPPSHQKTSRSQIETLADAVERTVDLSTLMGLAEGRMLPAKVSTTETVQKKKKISSFLTKSIRHLGIRVGIAYDEAFFFYYPDWRWLLEKNGVEIVYFSLLHDHSLPERLHWIIIGGGYPELYACQLPENRSMIRSLQEYVEKGGCLYAECGGFMYCSTNLELQDGTVVRMAGIFPFCIRMSSKLRHFGYRETKVVKDCFLARPGTLLRGHEFHYSEIVEERISCNRKYQIIFKSRRNEYSEWEPSGYMINQAIGTYIHHHPASFFLNGD